MITYTVFIQNNKYPLKHLKNVQLDNHCVQSPYHNLIIWNIFDKFLHSPLINGESH